MDPKTTTPTTDAQPEWRDPFCDPQTIPAGWDVSTILPASASKSEDEDANQTEDRAAQLSPRSPEDPD